MARINRSDIIQKAVNDLAINTSSDKVPTETLDKVQLVYSLNKQFSSFVSSTTRTTSGTGTLTLPTIDSRSEIFITSIDYNLIKDSTCDVATGGLVVTLTPNESGVASSVLSQGVITLTTQSEHSHVDFAYPLKIKPNTNATFTGTFSLGVCLRSLSITGFTTSSN